MTEDQFENKRGCAVCGSEKVRILFQQHFAILSNGSLMGGYDVAICQDCGFAFADNIPDQKVFDIYYHQMSKYEHQEHAGEATEFESRQFPEIARLVRGYLSSPQERILEIGCANGGLLNAIKKLGYPNVFGVDPSPVCAKNAENLYHVQVSTDTLSTVSLEIGQFNFIILVAVLEHIRDIEGALKKLDQLLAPSGRILIEVPDATRFADSPDAPFQEFSIEHINFFSPISLANLLAAHGFSQTYSAQTSSEQTDAKTGYAIRAIFGRRNDRSSPDRVYDSDTKRALTAYIEKSQAVENRIHQAVDSLVANGKQIIVWGVGTHTQRLLATSRLSGAQIAAFVDSNPNYHGKRLNGKPILSPSELQGRNEPILVSSRIFQSEIVRQIRVDLKLQNEVFTLYEV